MQITRLRMVAIQMLSIAFLVFLCQVCQLKSRIIPIMMRLSELSMKTRA